MNAPVPFEFQIWGPEACAEYFGQSKEVFLRETRHTPGFPAELKKGPKHRWGAWAVATWAATP